MSPTTEQLPIRKVVALRSMIRHGDRFGACHFVSAVLNRAYGWEVVAGCAECACHGHHVAHRWNRLPDGTLFDGTADQFENYDPGTDLGIKRYHDSPETYHENCDCYASDSSLDAQVDAVHDYIIDCAARIKDHRKFTTPPWVKDPDWWDECGEFFDEYEYIPKEMRR